jgi:hypothetical protein
VEAAPGGDAGGARFTLRWPAEGTEEGTWRAS